MTTLLNALLLLATTLVGVDAGFRELFTWGNKCYGYGECPSPPHEWYRTACKGPGETQTVLTQNWVTQHGKTLAMMVVETGPEHARKCHQRERVSPGEEIFHLSTFCGERIDVWVRDADFFNDNGKSLNKGSCAHDFTGDACQTCGKYSFIVDCSAWAGEACDGGESGECVAGAARDNNCGCKTAYRTSECRAADGACSPAVNCSGSSASCPVRDAGAADGEECGAAEGECGGAAVCAGGECVATPGPNGVPCGDGDGLCSSSTCQDGVCTTEDKDGEECGAAEGECGGAAVCAGGECVATPGPNGVPCGDGDGLCSSSTCQNGECRTSPKDEGKICKEGKGHCQGESVCKSGVCEEQPAEVAEGDVCGPKPSGPCENRSRCTAGVCEKRYKGRNVVCRKGTGKCDPDETCDGRNAECPQDICIDGSFNDHTKDD